MTEETVKGEEAIRRMAQRAMGTSTNPSQGSNNPDPIKEAQNFTRQMAANRLVEAELAKSDAAVEEAKAKAEEAKARAEKARAGGSGGGGDDGQVKVRGNVNLGDFNYQDILDKQLAERDSLRKEAQDQLGQQAAVSDDLRERLHAKEIEVLTTSFNAQMQSLKDMVAANVSRGSFVDQYNSIMETAKTIGLSAPQGGGDFKAQLELEKMKFEQSMELKRFTREEKKADREFQRQLNRDEDARQERREEQARQAQRDEMWAKTPQVIGGAIAQGLLSGQGKGSGSRVAEQPSPEPQVSKGGQKGHVEAGWGDSGEVDCPDCGERIAVGPTATTAVCANCGGELLVKRVGDKPARK